MNDAAKECLEQYGYWLDNGPDDGLWIFVPAGNDPEDGAPLMHARKASEREAHLWETGQHYDLGVSLGLVRPQRLSTWHRMVRALASKIGWN